MKFNEQHTIENHIIKYFKNDLKYEYIKPEEFAKVKVLTMFTTAPANIMSKNPVRNLNDIKGMDIRASGGAAEILKAWGANPVGMPMPATVEALQKGTVKGLISSLDCRYVTMTETSIYPFAVVMNMETWNSLPKDVQKVMDDLAVEQAEWTGNYMDNHVKESVAWSKQNYNVEIVVLPPAEKAEWDKKLQPITDKWVADAKAKGLPAEAIIADIKESIRKHSKK